MASSSSYALVLATIMAAALLSSVSAQDITPTPAPNTGDGYSLGMSTAVICSSLFFSMLALFKH